jgi:hypothetical protein
MGKAPIAALLVGMLTSAAPQASQDPSRSCRREPDGGMNCHSEGPFIHPEATIPLEIQLGPHSIRRARVQMDDGWIWLRIVAARRGGP